ncbi:hypothetical protein C2E23DRAFT_880425 [Lenzites betulinus]|nr:hypothetical protein C2E23DRAFT_880425 [Lenzites betulinus]
MENEDIDLTRNRSGIFKFVFQTSLTTVTTASYYHSEHRRSPNIAYALFDFGLSFMLPLDASIEDCRRPSVEASYGQRIYNPANVSQGERYYNPFPFDVGCLGNLYLNWLNSAIPVVPLLAPFLGKTTTHVVRDRFTAEEALAFLTEIRAPLSPEALDAPIEQ